jgi:hypothetical protein
VNSTLEQKKMNTSKKSTKYSIAAMVIAVGSIILYELFPDAKLIQISFQFKIFLALTIITLSLFLLAIFYSVTERNIKAGNSLILLATFVLIIFSGYISYQTVLRSITPSEREVALQERLKEIQLLQASEIEKISVSRYLQPQDFKDIDPESVAEGKIFIQEIKNKDCISDLIAILNKCSFEKWPRYKPKGESFYIALYSIEKAKIEFDVSHIKGTENTYEIFSFNSKDPDHKEYHGAAYSVEICNWINSIKESSNITL